MQTLLEAAVEYLNGGRSVIALAGKQPNTLFHKRGVHDPITGTVEPHGDHPRDSYKYDGCPGCADREQLRSVFEHRTTTGIGLPIWPYACVIDIDGEEGAEQWRDLAGGTFIPETPVARTGRGLHLWFATTSPVGNAKLGPKLDLKGVGGYVAAPPSRHPDGHFYEWLLPLMTTPFDFLPDGVEQLLLERAKDDELFHVERPVYTQYQLSLQDGAFRLATEVVPPPIDGLVKAVETAPEGNRNNILVWAALKARDEGVKMEDALRDLGAAATAAGLEPREIRTTIRSAYRRSRTNLA